MNILLNGISGHMGREVVKLCAEGYRDATLIMGVDPMYSGGESVPVFNNFAEIASGEGIDCIVDFSHHSLTEALLDFAEEFSIPVVLATTGHTEEEIGRIRLASERIPVFYSANMSLGIALLCELAKNTAAAFPEADIEIIEKHHNRKIDAPSGTALMLATALTEVREDAFVKAGRSGQGKREKAEIGVHAIRMANIVGEHEVIVGTKNQTITLKHEAHSRALFAEGALCAAEYITSRKAGLYNMKS